MSVAVVVNGRLVPILFILAVIEKLVSVSGILNCKLASVNVIPLGSI